MNISHVIKYLVLYMMLLLNPVYAMQEKSKDLVSILAGTPTVSSENFASNFFIKILTGQQTTPKWMVSLQTLVEDHRDGEHEYISMCGGTLINAHWILTAAHCVKDEYVSTLRAQIGETSLKYATESYSISDIIIYPDYKVRAKHNLLYIHDIALLKLKNPVEISDYVQLPDSIDAINNIPSVLGYMNAYGYGITSCSDTSLPDLLHHTRLRFIPDHKPYLYPWFLCAGGDDRHDTAIGDSGGPLLFDGIQYGITSYGPYSPNSHQPGKYTNIAYYLPWIEDVTGHPFLAS